MSVPRGRVAYGSHTFPFTGLDLGQAEPHPLPLIPLRCRSSDGVWSSPFNAVLDTGSTRTLLPMDLADRVGLKAIDAEVVVKGAGSRFPAGAAHCHVSVVDANLPTITCWEVADAVVWVPKEEGFVDFPIMGWDLLSLFEVWLNQHEQVFSLRYPPR